MPRVAAAPVPLLVGLMHTSRLRASLPSTITLVFLLAPLATAGAAAFTLQRTYLGAAPQDQFGFAVHAAGDVNGDGYVDFLVGANVSDAGVPGGGAISLFSGGMTYAGAPWKVRPGTIEMENSGSAVAGGGDLNADGYDDWAVGASGPGPSGTAPGCVYVFFGGPTPDVVPDRVIQGVLPGGQFGAAVVVGADLDGDGHGDLVIGAPRAGDGEISIYRGGPGFLAAGPARLVHARASDNRFGKSLAWLPDTDGDGCDDLLVGVPRSSAAATWAGAVLLYRGTAALDTLPDLVLLGQAAGDEFGASLAAGADVDGDAAADFLVGAPLANPNGRTDAGRAYFFRAGPALDAVADRSFDGASAGAFLGSAVASGFDWDGDSNWDIAIGAPGDDTAGLDAGRCAIILGGAALDASVDAAVLGPTSAAQLGSALAGVPGLRHDGRGALLLGAFGGNANGQTLVYGSADAPVDAGVVPDWDGARLLPPFPNPAVSGLRTVLETRAPGRWNVDIFDARGRLVAHLFAGFLGPGTQVVAWNGHDHGGVAVPSGVYCIRAASRHKTLTTRAIVVR